MKPANTLLSSYGTTVFEIMSRLAIEHKAINLGQGFPDDLGPDPVLEAASKALYDPPNQYPPMLGVPELRQAVTRHLRLERGRTMSDKAGSTRTARLSNGFEEVTRQKKASNKKRPNDT